MAKAKLSAVGLASVTDVSASRCQPDQAQISLCHLIEDYHQLHQMSAIAGLG